MLERKKKLLVSLWWFSGVGAMSIRAMDQFSWTVAATCMCSGLWMHLSKHHINLLYVNHAQMGA